MKYQETKEISKKYKQQYVNGLEHLLARREADCETVRETYRKDIFTNPKKYREDFQKMLGWPLVGYTPEQLSEPKSEKLSDENGYSVYRMQFEILKGVFLTGLFFQVDGKKNPLVIFQHGGAGTPEFAAGVYGSSEYYYDVIQNLTGQGAHVFAPQLLLWDETYGVEYDRKAMDAHLKRVGSSITAIEIHGIQTVLDYFEKKDSVSNFGMVGLSYGGFYTLYTAALDTRIKSAVSCAFFNQRSKYPFSDWTWFESAKLLDDAEIACLIYPRKLCVELGNRDDLFSFDSGVAELQRLKTLCCDVGCDWLEFLEFDGIHEFCPEVAPLVRLVKHLNDIG
ncbi:MAG: hypothetical protein J6A61_04005 [Clostridia bacterium]|nr:hypothetical protein [Clostridia bacterium]